MNRGFTVCVVGSGTEITVYLAFTNCNGNEKPEHNDINTFFVFLVVYLMILSVSRL
jgi:hypothetical protein